MEDHPLLSDLCSSCNTSLPKYRCPRCSSRTCSLPCYKRHQRWACCSGKRDPAAYLPRSKLATPAGIDHDYNFLAAIERDVQQPRQSLSLGAGSLRRQHRWNGAEAGERERELPRIRNGRANIGRSSTEPTPESNIKKRLDACGIIVERLPAGMSRQLENRTRWQQKRKQLIWTIEWFHPDGSRNVRNCPEDIPLREAYEQVLSQRASSSIKQQKRKHSTTESLSVKLASSAAPVGGENTTISQNATNMTDYASAVALSLPLLKDDQESNNAEQNLSDKTMDLGHVIPEKCPSKSMEATRTISLSTELHSSPQQQQSLPAQPLMKKRKTRPHDENQIKTEDENHHTRENDHHHHHQQSQFRFFLRHPHTRGSTRVLTPLSPTDCLANALSGQVILEFPTVQVFPLNTDNISQMNRVSEHVSLDQDVAGRIADTGSQVAIAAQNGAGGERHNNDGVDVDKGRGKIGKDKATANVSYTPTLCTEEKGNMWGLPDGYIVVSRT